MIALWQIGTVLSRNFQTCAHCADSCSLIGRIDYAAFNARPLKHVACCVLAIDVVSRSLRIREEEHNPH